MERLARVERFDPNRDRSSVKNNVSLGRYDDQTAARHGSWIQYREVPWNRQALVLVFNILPGNAFDHRAGCQHNGILDAVHSLGE